MKNYINLNFIAEVNFYLANIYNQTDRTENAKLLLNYNIANKILPSLSIKTKSFLDEINKGDVINENRQH
jgi:hypothetical protein